MWELNTFHSIAARIHFPEEKRSVFVLRPSSVRVLWEHCMFLMSLPSDSISAITTDSSRHFKTYAISATLLLLSSTTRTPYFHPIILLILALVPESMEEKSWSPDIWRNYWKIKRKSLSRLIISAAMKKSRFRQSAAMRIRGRLRYVEEISSILKI